MDAFLGVRSPAANRSFGPRECGFGRFGGIAPKTNIMMILTTVPQSHCRARLDQPQRPLHPRFAPKATCSASKDVQNSIAPVAESSVSLVLLAGGVGKRMGAAIPKQYLKLCGREIATYSMMTFAGMEEIGEMIIVCEPEWRDVFTKCYDALVRKPPLKFALPGKERQDSVYNGLQLVSQGAELVAIHDSARPLIRAMDALACFEDAKKVGAAVLGVPVKPTIKEVDKDLNVIKTLQRSTLWEVQTPQVIRPSLLLAGFDLVARNALEVTDDVSIVEALGKPVVITPGSYTNIKVTTPDDMSVAERFLEECTSPLTLVVAAEPEEEEEEENKQHPPRPAAIL